MLHLVGERSLLQRVLALLRRESAQSAWHANALLGCAVALAWALGASVPLSTLFEPSGVLGAGPASGRGNAADVAALTTGGGGLSAWRTLKASLTQPALRAHSVELLLSILGALLREPAQPGMRRAGVPPVAAGGGVQGGLPSATSQGSGVAPSQATGALPPRAVPAGTVSIRLAGGFVLHADHAYTAEQRVELLFALPGSTMLDTLIGLLLASCLKEMTAEGTEPAPVAASSSSPSLLDVLLAATMPTETAAGGLTSIGAVAGAGSAVAAIGAGGGPRCIQLSILDFLNAVVGGEGFAAALAGQLRLSLATRHLRAFTLLLQFGPSSVAEAEAGDLKLRLRRFGTLCCAYRLLSDSLQLNLIRSLMRAAPGGGGQGQANVRLWPLKLPAEPLAFYTRVLLERLRARGGSRGEGGGGERGDDPLLMEVLGSAIAALHALASEDGSPATPPPSLSAGGVAESPILPLQHCQLLLLLWHAMRESARGEVLAKTACAFCTATTAVSKAEALQPAQWVALHRLLQLLQYMLKHYEAVPTHLPQQLNHLLLAPKAEASSPFAIRAGSDSVTSTQAPALAMATVSFEPSSGQLQLGTAVVGSSANGSKGPSVTFSTQELYELVGSGERDASPEGLAALANHHAVCSSEMLLGSLTKLLDTLHQTPPRSASLVDASSPRSEVLAAMGAQAYHAAWRLLSAFPAPLATPSPDQQGAGAAVSVQAIRGLLASSPDATTADRDSVVSHCARMLAASALEARGGEAGCALERSPALTSALSLALESSVRPSREAGGEGSDSDASALPPGSNETTVDGAALLSSDAMLSSVLADVASAVTSLATGLRTTVRSLMPPSLSADSELATAVLACKLGGSRTSQLLALLSGASSSSGGGLAAAKAMAAIGEPLPLLKLALGKSSSDAETRRPAQQQLLDVLLTHMLAPLIAKPLVPPSTSASTPASTSGADRADDRRRPATTGAAESSARASAGAASSAGASQPPSSEASSAAQIASQLARRAAALAAAEDAEGESSLSGLLGQATANAIAEAERRLAMAGAPEAADEEEDEEEDDDAELDDDEDGEDDMHDDHMDAVARAEAEAEAEREEALQDEMLLAALAEGRMAIARNAAAAAREAAREAARDKELADAAAREAERAMDDAHSMASPASVAATASSAADVAEPPNAPATPATPAGSGSSMPATASLPHAFLQLALHSVLRAALALVGAITTTPDGAARTRRAGHALVHALLPLHTEPCLGFAQQSVRSLLSALLPADANQCLADLQHLRRIETFLSLAQASLAAAPTLSAPAPSGVAAALASSGSRRTDARNALSGPPARADLLVALMGECIEQIEPIARSSHRQAHLCLFYAGFETPTGAEGASPGDGAAAAASSTSMMEVGAATPGEAHPLPVTPGDLSTLVNVLSGPGHTLSAQVLALLLRALALPSALTTSLPPLHTPSGARMVPARTSLRAHLAERLLALDETHLEQWLHGRLVAGTLAASGAKPGHISGAAAVISAAGGSLLSGMNGATASAAASKGLTPWVLVAQLIRVLFPIASSSPSPAAPSPAASEVANSARLGQRLWMILRGLLAPAFQPPWPSHAQHLFETLRYLAVATGRVADLVEVTISTLSDLRQRSSGMKLLGGDGAAGAGGGAGGRPGPGPGVAGASAAGGTSAQAASPSAGSQEHALWLLLGFLEQVLNACDVQLVKADAGGKPRGAAEGGAGASEMLMSVCSEADDEPGSDEVDRGGAMDVSGGGGGLAAPAGQMDLGDDDSEEALACKVCTFAVTGSNFTEQHWYYCYTCGLTQSEGCCSICVKVCHRGHVVSYSRRSRFFCDCGAGAAAARGINCIALQPRRSAGASSTDSSSAAAAALAPTAGSRLAQAAAAKRSGDGGLSGSSAMHKGAGGAGGPALPRLPHGEPIVLGREEGAALFRQLAALGYVEALFSVYTWLLGELQRSAPADTEPGEADLFTPTKRVSTATDLLTPRHSVRAGAFDLKQKTDGPHTRELRTLLQTGGLVKSVLSASSKGFVALAEADKLHILDITPALAADPKLPTAPGSAAGGKIGRASWWGRVSY